MQTLTSDPETDSSPTEPMVATGPMVGSPSHSDLALIIAILAPLTITGLLVLVGVGFGAAVCIMFVSVFAVTTTMDVRWFLGRRRRTNEGCVVKTVHRLSAFGAVLAGMFAIGIGAGAAFGPDASAKEAMAPAPMGEGVVSTRDGYRFVPATRQLARDGGTFHFVIEGPAGTPVLDFQQEHEKDLHFILVNRDLTVFHHVHPTLAADGTWSIDLPALPAGSYRAVADFHVADGPRLALGTDLSVAGDYTPTALAEPSTTSNVDGFEITMRSEVRKGGEVEIALTVRRDGKVITDLQPYLGAFGHLVAMRSGDLAYAHVHPDDYVDGTVDFDAELGAEGRYGLFFDFKYGDTVHTATFTFDQGLVIGAAPSMHD